MDECAQGTDECHLNATCDNTISSYTCECVTGLTGNGITCDGMCMYIFENGQYGWKVLCNSITQTNDLMSMLLAIIR